MHIHSSEEYSHQPDAIAVEDLHLYKEGNDKVKIVGNEKIQNRHTGKLFRYEGDHVRDQSFQSIFLKEEMHGFYLNHLYVDRDGLREDDLTIWEAGEKRWQTEKKYRPASFFYGRLCREIQ